MIVLFQLFLDPRPRVSERNYSEFLSAVENNRVRDVEALGRNITWKDIEGKQHKTYAPEDPEMIKLLREKRVTITAKSDEPGMVSC
jgi:cell division protease FtsH